MSHNPVMSSGEAMKNSMSMTLCLVLLWVQTGHGQRAVGDTPTAARSQDGSYISWREHIIDDTAAGGVAIRGSDGLVMADLALDGVLDVVSVHESDGQRRTGYGRHRR